MSRIHLVFVVLAGCLAAVAIFGCSLSSGNPRTIYVTATPNGQSISTAIGSPVPDMPDVIPTGDPLRVVSFETRPQEHMVIAGDTLTSIANRYSLTLNSILIANPSIDPNLLSIGQKILLPPLPQSTTPNIKIIPDILFVRGPGSESFDIRAYISTIPGYIRLYTDEVPIRIDNGSEILVTLDGASIIERVAQNYSIDPRLLLALIEYRSKWLSRSQIAEAAVNDPLSLPQALGETSRDGLYSQLTWAANQLNQAYYGWKIGGLLSLELLDSGTYTIAATLNAATVAIQVFWGQILGELEWHQAISRNGFYRTYYTLFGNPFANEFEHIPPNLSQPRLLLPFASDEIWYFTGGAHGGWGSGSAWAALDFAPPDDPPPGESCYTSRFWVRAVAPGIIVRSDEGAVVLDLDNDGFETTGWTILYLHLASEKRVDVGTTVAAGDPLGHAACAGGFSTATHLHIARRFNGEWIDADCHQCSPHHPNPIFVMNGWETVGIPGQEYQGFLARGDERRIAEQGRSISDNRIAG